MTNIFVTIGQHQDHPTENRTHQTKSIHERKFMSNHTGSYMINDILKTLEKISVFEILGREKSRSLVLDILEISTQYDCNPGEVLQDIGEKIGICYHCQSAAEEFHDDICKLR